MVALVPLCTIAGVLELSNPVPLRLLPAAFYGEGRVSGGELGIGLPFVRALLLSS
jgi:hypothetical protein